MTGLEGDWKELGAGFELEQGLVGLRETEDGFDSGFGVEQGLVGLGETENGFAQGLEQSWAKQAGTERQLQRSPCKEYEQWS